MASNMTTNPDALVTLKVNIEGSNRRFKIPLRDCGASSLEQKVDLNIGLPAYSISRVGVSSSG
jgi:next-to-BRCA1 protein 1